MKNIFLILILVLSYNLNAQFGESTSCEKNVFCYPDWCNQRRSVGLIFIDGNSEPFATGFLISNDKGDGKPFFLTAKHVVDLNHNSIFEQNEIEKLENIKIVFNYQFNNCNNSNIGTEPSLSEFVIGADIVSYSVTTTIGGQDWILLELTDDVANTYAAYFSGFNTTDALPESVCMIHHPSGDVKKISFYNDAPEEKIWTWLVDEWDVGGAEFGSSGAPVYNNEKLIVGIQSANGDPSDYCSTVKSYSSLFYKAWNNQSNTNNQLKHWLNSSPTNGWSLTFISGYDPCKTSINFSDANDLHISDNVNIFTNGLLDYGTRSYNGIYNSSGTISANSNVIIQSNTSVEFYGESIELNPGFTAESGCVFIAEPKPCLGGCNNGKSMIEQPEIEIIKNTESKYLNLNNKTHKVNKIYPNPTLSELNIEVSSNFIGGEINIYSVLGEIVYTEKINNRLIMISEFETLKSGIYTVIFINNNLKEIQKVIKYSNY